MGDVLTGLSQLNNMPIYFCLLLCCGASSSLDSETGLGSYNCFLVSVLGFHAHSFSGTGKFITKCHSA